MSVNCSKFRGRTPRWPVRRGWGKWTCLAGGRKFGGNLVAALQYLWGDHQEERARLFIMVHGRKTMDYGHKLKHGRFIVVRGLLTLRICDHWNKLHRSFSVSILGVFKKSDGKSPEKPSLILLLTLLGVGGRAEVFWKSFWTWLILWFRDSVWKTHVTDRYLP